MSDRFSEHDRDTFTLPDPAPDRVVEAETRYALACKAIDRFGWLERGDDGELIAWRPLRSWSRSRAVQVGIGRAMTGARGAYR